MNTLNSQAEAAQQFDLKNFEVEAGYFKTQMDRFEEMYRTEFPSGWGEFFAAYSIGQVDKTNLDYDEWAFLCEHFMYQSWAWDPPEDPTDPHREKSETISGFSVLGENSCLTRTRISPRLTGLSMAVAQGSRHRQSLM